MFVLACGITFPVAMLPAWAQLWAWLLPPTYIVEDMRQVLLRGAGIADVLGDVVVVLALASVIGAFAIAVFRYLESSARRTGMLGRF
jgi:ABC-2 type transport system permease protein